MTYQGGCLCGVVRYAAQGEPLNQRVCHCRLCQKALGASFNARLLFRREVVRITGTYTTFASSPEVLRGFCANCGTTLFAERASAGTIGVTAGSLDDSTLFRPEMEIWTAGRQPWMSSAAGLPEHAGAAP